MSPPLTQIALPEPAIAVRRCGENGECAPLEFGKPLHSIAVRGQRGVNWIACGVLRLSFPRCHDSRMIVSPEEIGNHGSRCCALRQSFLESEDAEGEQRQTHHGKNCQVQPELRQRRAAQDDGAHQINEIRRG